SETIGFVRGKLAEVLFRGDDVYKQLRALSGGEAARLVMAKLSVARPNILVLDEPTNHLDLEAIEAFVQGLEAYDGSILFVSHDRWFVSRLANRILEITHNGIRDFEGSYEDYLSRCGDDHLDADVVLARARQDKKKESAKKGAGKPTPAQEKQAKSLVQRRDKLTADIEKAESRVHAINEMFCNPGFFDKTGATEVKKLEAEQKTLSGKIEEGMAEWAKLESEIAELVPAAPAG
ncbi:MAG: ATP-binding cassette domain-containing protein, partial [Thermoanaerobaculia bacterium]